MHIQVRTASRCVSVISMANDRSHHLNKSPRNAFAQIITVLVGPNKNRFCIHENLLKLHSDYFRAALEGTWKEAITKTFTLSDENPDVFNLFVHWLYHMKSDWSTASKDNDIEFLLVEAYLFAERRAVSYTHLTLPTKRIV